MGSKEILTPDFLVCLTALNIAILDGFWESETRDTEYLGFRDEPIVYVLKR